MEKKIAASVSSLSPVKAEATVTKSPEKASGECAAVTKQLKVEAKEDLISKRHVADLKQAMKDEEFKIKSSEAKQANIPNANWAEGQQPKHQTKIQKEQIKVEQLEENDIAARKAAIQAHEQVEKALKNKNASLETKESLMKFEAKAVAAEKSAAQALLKESKIVEKIVKSESQAKFTSGPVYKKSTQSNNALEKEQAKIESLENKEIETRQKLAIAHAKVEATQASSSASL